MTRRCCLAAVIVYGLLNGGAGLGDDAAGFEGNYSGSLVLDVDREAEGVLTSAEKELDDGQTAAGLLRLQELLDRPVDVLVQRGSSYVSLWELVNRRISRLSAGDLSAYHRIVRGHSEAALAAALHSSEPDAVARLTDRYRHTPVGHHAALLLTLLAFDRGDGATAESWVEFLGRHTPELELPSRLLRRQPFQEPDGDPSRASGPASAWSLDLGVTRGARQAIDGAVAELNAQALNPMLTCHPLLVDQRILTRTLKGLICVDAASGELMWEHPIACHTARLAAAPGTLDDPIRTGQISALLLRRLIRDSLQDELSTDGETVFTLVTGDRSAEDEPRWPVNTLRAIDIATGKLRWELKPPSRVGPAGRRRSAARQARYFLGPPLIGGDQLLLPAQHGQNVELVALERHSGQLLSSVTIGQSVRDLWATKTAGLDEQRPEDRERQSTACRISRSGAYVLVPTGAGVIACIDLARQRLVWAYRYPRRDLTAAAPSAGDETHFRQMPTRDAFVAAASWIIDEIGICLAPDADRILAFDLPSGRLLWSRRRGDAVQVLPDAGGLLLLVGGAEVTALNRRSGLRAWSTPVDRPAGRSIIDNDQLIIPVSEDHFNFVRIGDGTRVVDAPGAPARAGLTVTLHPPPSLQRIPLRSLSHSSNVILCQSASTLARVNPTATPDPGSPMLRQRLERLVAPIAEWRREKTQLMGALRGLDSRAKLVDGLLVRALEHLGLKRSLQQQVERLLTAMRHAEADGNADSLPALRHRLQDLDSPGLYVTTSDGRHTCRLDRWMTGSDAGDPHAQALNRPGRPSSGDPAGDAAAPQTPAHWPEVSPRVSEHPTSLGLSYLQRIPIDEQQPGIWSDVTVEVDRQGRMIQLQDAAGIGPATILLPRESSVFRLQPRFLQGWSRGNVLLLRVGTELLAFHRTQRGKLPALNTWPAAGQTLSLLGDRTPLPTSLRELPDEAVPTWDTTSAGLEDVFGRGVGDVGPVRDGYLCYQRRGAIVALATDSGEELWRRTRWPVGTRCIGDDDCVIVFHPEDPCITVLGAHDGRTLSRWSLDDVIAPQRVTAQTPFQPVQINGSRALLAISTDAHLQLQAIDLRLGQVLWTIQKPASTLHFAVSESHLGLAIPATDDTVCSLEILDWATGTQTRSFEVRGPDDLQSVHVFSDAHQRYLILSGRITDLPLQNVTQIQGGLNRPLVNGWLHAFDGDLTLVRWSQPLENIAFPIVQPRHVPLLILNDMSQPAGSSTPQGRLLCLETRTGERVAEVRQPTHVYYTLDAARDSGRIDIRLQGRTLRLDYSAAISSDPQ
jgi:outer membrane protein assembly factor BamB